MMSMEAKNVNLMSSMKKVEDVAYHKPTNPPKSITIRVGIIAKNIHRMMRHSRINTVIRGFYL